MAAFGENLQREREMRGVTLEEISAATKISVRFLRAIEGEDFGALPGGVFTRSFIRTYARYLGLDEERVMAEFHLTGQAGADVDTHRLAPLKLPIQRSDSHTTLLVLLVAGIMLSAAYFLYRYSRRSIEVQVNPPSPAQHVSAATAPATSAGAPPNSPGQGTSQAGTPAASTPAAPSNPTETPATSTPGPAATPNPPGAPTSNANPASGSATGTQAASSGTAQSQPVAGESTPPASKQAGSNAGLVLQVAATESTWVGIEADGKTVLQRVLKANEVRNLTARESFDVTTGNAQGIILTLNGETLKPLGRRGEVKSVHLTKDDLKGSTP